MDDIVTRMRSVDFNCDYCQTWEACLEAADEIQRLREWKEIAYQMRNKYWWFMRANTLKKFDDMHKKDWKRHE